MTGVQTCALPILKFTFVTSCHGVYQVSGALKLLSNWGEHTLAVSEDIRDYLTEQYGLAQERITLTIMRLCRNQSLRRSLLHIFLNG